MSDFTNRSGFNTEVTTVGLADVHEVRLRGLASTATAPASRGQVDLFVQASQVAENLRAQVAELERRERNLNEQLSQFDREQRSLRLRALNAEEEARLRAEQLAQQEQQFSERFQQTEQLLAELKLRERELTQANQTLEQQRATLKQQLEKQNEVDKAAMQHSQAMADSERKQLSEERERLAREQQAILEAVQGEIEQEKARLRKEYAWELDGEIEHFRNQRESWNQQQALDREQLAADKRVHEEALRKLQADWAEQRRQQQGDLDATRRQMEQQRQQLQREHDEALRRLQLNWETERQQLRVQWAADLDEEKHKFAEERAAFETARDRDRAIAQRDRESHDGYVQKSLADLQSQRKQLDTDLRKLREDHAQQLRTDAVDFDQQKADWERQRAAQWARLNDMQRDLELAQREVARSWQSGQSEMTQRTADLDRRDSQLTHFRQQLDEKEQSLARESETLQRWQSDRSQEVASDRHQLERERAEFELRRTSELVTLKQQAEQRSLEMEKLEARRQRFEMMRGEMESSNRLTLEARLAMEEAWAELLPTVDPETIRRRIEAGRAAIAEHYRRIRDELEVERQQLKLERLQFQDHARRLQDQIRTEREQQPTALAIREEQVRLAEQRLKAETNEWEKREGRWYASRAKWLEEKCEAEQIIRGLLDQVNVLPFPTAKAA